MSNLDLKKVHKNLYAPSAKVVSVVTVPPFPYLMIDGEGNPNTTPRYGEAIEALYGLAYGIRAIRKAAGETFTVMPLEGLWWFREETDHNFKLTDADKDRFAWTLMILQPKSVTTDIVEEARQNARRKKAPAALDDVRFAIHDEGEVVQIMHIGSYDDEGPTVEKLHQHIAEHGWELSGLHHEIYLSDPRKVAPEKMKTVIRQPFRRG